MTSYRTHDNQNVEATVDDLGRVEVSIQDQTTQIITARLFRNDGTFTLAADVAIGDKAFTAVADHDITAGDVLCFQSGTQFMQASALTVDINDITIDVPFDFAYPAGTACSNGVANAAVNGAVTPVTFRVGPVGLAVGQKWDITQITLTMTDDTAMDDAKFGGITALTNGLLLRQNNGITHNMVNLKSNGAFILSGFDVSYADKAPAGIYGFRARRIFAGQANSGVTVRLNAGGDLFQMIVQDDLSGLTTLHATVVGHLVD